MAVILRLLLGVMIIISVGACGQQELKKLSIVSGSENKSLESLITELGRKNGLEIDVTYLGSVDIGREMKKGTGCTYDAVWPASSLWIALGDTQHVVKHSKSIMRSPVVLAVKKSLAAKLKWIGRGIRVQDILNAAESGQLRFAMTSATQSNSGASAYLGYLHAFAGNPDAVTQAHLQDPSVQAQIKRFLGNVHRQTGSSGWLMELLLEHYEQFDAMVNYEALVIEANQQLIKQGKEPLYVIYPSDGLTIADSPLAYVDHGDAELEKAFLKLQSALLEDDVQRQILAQGRRVGRVGMNMAAADAQIFNAAWGIDINRVLSTINLPSGEVISQALNLFQTAFRKPSMTVYVLDFSGSMKGDGERQVKAAMRTLLEPSIASQYLLQASPRDISTVIAFNGLPSKPVSIEGNEPQQLKNLLKHVEALQPAGGTNMYLATRAALQSLQTYESRMGGYHTAVIVMSDGRSKGALLQVESAGLWGDVPVYTILFGNADPDQMRRLADATLGRMFDGRSDMIHAFRQAKGYN